MNWKNGSATKMTAENEQMRKVGKISFFKTISGSSHYK